MTLTTRARRALLALSAVAALGGTTAATADAAISIRGTTPNPGLRYYLQTVPDSLTFVTSKQQNTSDPNQRWTQTFSGTTFSGTGSVFKNQMGACLVDFGVGSDGSSVRANPCNEFSVPSAHFRWDVLAGSVVGTVQLRNQVTGRYITYRDRHARIGLLRYLNTTAKNRNLKFGAL
jgi:hypothetical protein